MLLELRQVTGTFLDLGDIGAVFGSLSLSPATESQPCSKRTCGAEVTHEGPTDASGWSHAEQGTWCTMHREPSAGGVVVVGMGVGWWRSKRRDQTTKLVCE